MYKDLTKLPKCPTCSRKDNSNTKKESCWDRFEFMFPKSIKRKTLSQNIIK